jgi:hypothetical protein
LAIGLFACPLLSALLLRAVTVIASPRRVVSPEPTFKL